jgi:hypothetical protein
MADITVSQDLDSVIKQQVLQVVRSAFYPNASLMLSAFNAETRILNTGDTLDFSLQPERSKLIYSWRISFDSAFGLPSHLVAQQGKAVEEIIGGEYLIGLADAGTAKAFDASGCNMSGAKINAFFTDLPTASYTATLDFSNNPGSSSCYPLTATDKGYTVIT